ncbi:MAG TPA: methyltransferase [Candidatus Sulfotelmatobacter sp.]|nr:methyltransferase [Candidatus Sulfotelmatobacter sp.]
MSKAAEPRLDTVRLQGLALAYQQSATLMAAVEIGLFTAIAKGADSLAAIAATLAITPINAERLVTACVAMGLVERDGERFLNAPDVARFLVEGEPSYAGPWMLFTKPRWGEWGRLGDHLRRTGAPHVLGMYEHFTVEDARRYHAATYSIGMGAGRRFVRQVDLARRRLLLDLGGGSGAYSITAAKAHPTLRAIVFDLPPVAVVAREFIADHGVDDRVSAVAGDFTRDAFPAGADVAVMASNLPLYSREIIAMVIAKAHAALASGGEMHLIGETLDDDRAGPLSASLWGLSEALHDSTGVAHTTGECMDYFRRAGFRDVTVSAFVPGVLTRICGRKA